MEINNGDGKAKILAYYLPQFYPCEFNDKWYGKGFTEWTNVGKAKPLFIGHHQPKIPADLGFYDLRVPEVADQQAILAREAGVFGFAYWHYWWAGKRLLDMPAERMLKTQKPNFPFMFAWANENWYKKLWDKDAKKDTLIMEQTYPGEDDNLAHFNYCLPFFKDSRYITYDGRPLFLIYHPLDFPEVKKFMDQWNALIKKNEVADKFYWMAIANNKESELIKLKEMGFDCINFKLMGTRIGYGDEKKNVNHYINALRDRFFHLLNYPSLHDYNKVLKSIWVKGIDSRDDVLPTLIPRWDHTARSGTRGEVYINATPENFKKMAIDVLSRVKNKENKIVMLKSWNEWAEGNYMEPDLKYGKKFLHALKESIESTNE